MLNQTINKYKGGGSIIPFITIDGLQTYHPKKIANSFGQYYSTIGQNLASTITPGKNEIEHYLCKMPHTSVSFVIRETNVSEIKKLLKSLPNKSSHGHDKVSNVLLKALNTSILYPLQIIFNQSIYQGVFPDKMKLAEIILLYKGKEHNLVMNYRPISLLMTMLKVLEKIIYTCMYAFLELNGTLFNSQYGFMSKRSCEQAIAELLGNLLQAHNNKLHSTGIFLDLSKAFDTLNHDILLKKLDAYGM